MDNVGLSFARESQKDATPQEIAAQTVAAYLTAKVEEVGFVDRDTDNMPGYIRPRHYLGSGTYGNVELMYRHAASHYWHRVAVKTIPLYRFNSLASAEYLAAHAAREALLSQEGSLSPHVMQITNRWYDSRTWSVHLEMDAADESLETYVLRRHRCTLPPNFLLSVCAQCALALEHLHTRHVVHRDVKPGNYLVNISVDSAQPPLVRLTDFGLSCVVTDARIAAPNVGTPWFIAPEALVEGGGADKPTARDVWSLGVTFYILATGTLPIFRIADGRTYLAWSPNNFSGVPLSKEATLVLQIASGMLQYDYKQRYSINKVLYKLCSATRLPANLSQGDVLSVRRMRVCRPNARLPVYRTARVDPQGRLEAELLGGDTFLVLGRVDVPNLPSAPLRIMPKCNSLPCFSSHAQRLLGGVLAQPQLRRAQSSQPPSVCMTRWLHMVYPHSGYVQMCANGQHAVHFVSGIGSEETHLRCPPLSDATATEKNINIENAA